MRVLLWMADGDIIQGGHHVQIDQTALHLQKLGVKTETTFGPRDEWRGFDIVHGFGMAPDVMRPCRQSGVPIVTSSIYWGRENVSGLHRRGSAFKTWKARAKLGLILLKSALQGNSNEKYDALNADSLRQRITFEMADLLLPNSQSEAEAIRRELGVTTPCHVVPNSADHTLFTPEPQNGARDYILYCGRFEPHKNQLGLIRALKDESWPVRLVGKPHPHHLHYYELCRREAPPHIQILPGVPHEELVPLYRGARVHVLPSWSETTGLVSLEAALCGCNVVTTERGYTRDYFRDMAWYCDPFSSASIRKAVRAAWGAPLQTALRQHILDHFTWEHTARATLAGYEQILAWRREFCVPVASSYNHLPNP